MTSGLTDYELEAHEFVGVEQGERITRGTLIVEEGVACERCGDEIPVGSRTYLIGRIGPVDRCCRYCALVDGADDALLDGTADSPRQRTEFAV
jgi:hypothetical protein